MYYMYMCQNFLLKINYFYDNCSSLKNLVKDFQDLAEICLLLLHLEVRVHCFYFLLPVAKQVSESQWYNVLPKHNVLFLQNLVTAFQYIVLLYFIFYRIILFKLYMPVLYCFSQTMLVQ